MVANASIWSVLCLCACMRGIYFAFDEVHANDVGVIGIDKIYIFILYMLIKIDAPLTLAIFSGCNIFMELSSFDRFLVRSGQRAGCWVCNTSLTFYG